MELFFQELKKMRRPQYLVISLLLLALFCGFFSFLYFGDNLKITHADSSTLADSRNGIPAAELQFTDMLLERYGPSIEREELNSVRKQSEAFREQLNRALAEDRILRECGLTSVETLSVIQNSPILFMGEFSEDPGTNAYIKRCIRGNCQLPGTDYPILFAYQFENLLAGMEKAAEADPNSDQPLFYVAPDQFVTLIPEAVLPILAAALCSAVILVPYGILENSRHTLPLLCSTKAGRRMERRRLGAVIACILLMTALGILLSVIHFTSWDLGRYYPCIVDNAMMNGATHNGLYDGRSYFNFVYPYVGQGITFLGLYLRMAAAAAVAGISCALTAGLISFYQRNIITGYLAALVPIAVGVLFLYRYIAVPLGITSGELFHFSAEPWIILALLAAVPIAAAAAHLVRMRRCEIR